MSDVRACPVCGGDHFAYKEVLWPELIDDWELESHEVAYINRQQGLICSECGNSLRSMALADTALSKYKFDGTLRDFVESDIARALKILEINEAGGLTSTLAQLPGHLLVKHPEYDMTRLPFDRGTFDLVLHSDTLEHVFDPVAGLAECRRLLNQNGACIYTVPIIVGRLTRSREKLKLSFHGSNEKKDSEQIVYTEFGTDAWQWPIRAGFKSAAIHAFEFPAALAIQAE